MECFESAVPAIFPSYAPTFFTIWNGVVKLGCGHIGDVVKMLNLNKIFYSTLDYRALLQRNKQRIKDYL